MTKCAFCGSKCWVCFECGALNTMYKPAIWSDRPRKCKVCYKIQEKKK